jgi:hypothetical protein
MLIGWTILDKKPSRSLVEPQDVTSLNELDVVMLEDETN